MAEPQKTEIIAPEAQITDEQRAILVLNMRLEKVEKYLNTELGQQMSDIIRKNLEPIVNSVAQRFEQIDQRLGTGSAQGQSGGGGIFKFIDKIVDKIGPNLGGGSGDNSFAREMENTLHDIARDNFKLIQMDLRDLISARRGRPGLPEHIVLEH